MSVWSSLYTLDPNSEATEDIEYWDGFFDVARSVFDPAVLRFCVGREKTTLDRGEVIELRDTLNDWLNQ